MSVDITVNDLVISSFATIGAYSPYKIPSGEEINSAIYYLNELLDYFQVNGVYIPFFKTLEFTMIISKDTYDISTSSTSDIVNNPLVELDWVTVHYSPSDNVSYPVSIVSYDQYDTFVRNQQSIARPNKVIFQKDVDKSTLIFFPLPDYDYICKLRGKFYLSDVKLQDHLSEIPGYYHRFLRYALARELKNIYKSDNWSDMQEKEYSVMLNEIKGNSDFALAIDQNPVFGIQSVMTDEKIGVIS